jgi:hypothetical protein
MSKELKELKELVTEIKKRNEAKAEKFIMLRATIIGKQKALKFWLNDLTDKEINDQPIYKKAKIELELLNELIELT